MADLKQTIARLNELYHSSKTTSLSDAELTERDRLRQEYLAMVRGQVKASLENIEVTNEAGDLLEPGHPHSHKKQ
jgi:uncharacterized protein YnzC (UPF0291/DUF896 family)